VVQEYEGEEIVVRKIEKTGSPKDGKSERREVRKTERREVRKTERQKVERPEDGKFG
jgi:hypothetical protein